MAGGRAAPDRGHHEASGHTVTFPGARIARILTVAVLVITGALGLRNGVTEWPAAQGVLQQSVTAGVFLYGVLGAVSAFGVFQGRQWSLWTTAAWGGAITYVGSAAVLAYGGPDATRASAIVAGVVSALIATAVFWAARTLVVRE